MVEGLAAGGVGGVQSGPGLRIHGASPVAHWSGVNSGFRIQNADRAVLLANVSRFTRPPPPLHNAGEVVRERRMRGWYFIGDSHVQSFDVAATIRLLNRPARCLAVPGATSIGLRNPESQTHAVVQFKEALLPARPDAIPVIQLGEVDCGFVVWWRAQKHGDCVDRQMEDSVAACAAFVDDLLEGGYSTLVLTGAVLPTIRDGQTWGQVARARHEVTATLRQRTALTHRYNACLREEAEARGLPFIDITPRITDPKTGLVADAFRSPNPRDHHLDPIRAAEAWAEALNALDLPS